MKPTLLIIDEKRDYKAEYKKYGSSTKAKKYRAELNKYNRKKGTYGNGDGKDASHKGGKIVGFESQSKNRGRAEKSRLKKESSVEYGKSLDKIANDKKLKMISKKDRETLKKLAKLLQKELKEGKLNSKLKKAILIAIEMSGNMTGAVEKIEKIKKGLSKDKKVADALRLANESVNEAANKIADIRKILKTKKGKRIDSIFMDVETAEEVMKHYKSLGRGAKERLTKQKIQNIVKSVKKANESVNEEVTKGKAVQKIFDIYENGYGKLGGRMLDSLSAGLFVQLYNKAPDKIKQKMDKMNEKRLYVVIGKMWDKFGKGVTLS